ncbi:unnamed protein product [Lactuca saligna]|uniref:Disease resistance protein At4g27190-like leucine-rich repeats domain-containing protein n=1 Tax=Lactuca saligna TaxID=75948 RepID=A0AA35V4I1_LACSI|nr:unnamed protein product [Lactuca saligna]
MERGPRGGNPWQGPRGRAPGWDRAARGEAPKRTGVPGAAAPGGVQRAEPLAGIELPDSTPYVLYSRFYMCFTPDFIKLLQFPWSFSNLVEVDDELFESRIIFPCKELLNLKNLEKLSITRKYGESKIKEVFEVAEGTNEDVDIETQSVVVFEKLKEVTLDGLHDLKHMWKSNRWIVLNFPNLTKVSITRCGLLGHVFSSCMVGSLLQLQELKISDCESMDVIVKQVEDSETRPTTELVFPCLKSITLHELPNIKGFCLGKEAFEWPSYNFWIVSCNGRPKLFYKDQTTRGMGVLEQHQIHTCGLVRFEVSYIAQLLAYYSFNSGY